MRKTKTLLIALTALICGGILAACDSNGGTPNSPNANTSITSNDSEKIEIKDSGAAQVDKYEIVGAQDLHIAQAVTDISNYTSKVSAVCEDKVAVVTVDDSKVQYGTQGVYDLVYTYGELTKTVKVTVYGAPQITLAENAKTEYAYAEYYGGVTQGLQANDCFGKSLDIRLYDNKGAENKDGSLNAGTYEMVFAAVDKAGQIVYANKTVTIQAGAVANGQALYGYDVADENLVITLSEEDVDAFFALSLNGEVVPASAVSKEGDSLIVDGDYLYSAYQAEQTIPLRILTVNGYVQSEFKLTDSGTVAYDDSALQEYVQSAYECFVAQEIPAIVLTNSKQSVTPVYTLKKGDEVIATDREVTFTSDGTYTLEVALREGQVLQYKLVSFFNLGFLSGTAYYETSGMDTQLNETYNLVGYTVYNYKGTEILTYLAAEDSDGSKFEGFNTAFKALSKKQAYTMKVDATAKNTADVISQTIDFTLSDSNTTSLLTDSKDGEEYNVRAVNAEYAELKYVSTSVGGRVGAYKWTAKSEAATSSTLLSFNAKFSSVMTKGAYLSFDIYAEKAISLVWFGNETSYLYNDVSGWTNAKMFNQLGNPITEGGFWSGDFKGQWVTIEIPLDEDYNSNSIWRGLSIYSSGLYGNNVYLSNIKVSTESFLNDGVITPEIPDDSTDTPDTPVTTGGTILADEADLDNMYVSDSTVASLTYVEEGAGRTGVFKWSTDSATDISGDSARLHFADTADNRAWLETGSYLTFDFYTDKAVSIYWAGPDWLLYNLDGDDNANVKIYDANGFLISDKKIWTGGLVNTWVTFEIKLDRDYPFTQYAGFSVYSSGFNSSTNVYFDNVKISNTAIVPATAGSEGVILADEADLSNVYSNNSEVASFTYVEEGAGRTGVFKMATESTTTVSGTNATLRFAETKETSAWLKAGSYLSFDICVTGPVTLCWFNDPNIYLYNGVGGTANVKFYNEDGELLTEGSIWGGSFNGQWITVEICLTEDYIFTSQWRGLGVYGNGFTNENPLYIDNIKVSTTSMNNNE